MGGRVIVSGILTIAAKKQFPKTMSRGFGYLNPLFRRFNSKNGMFFLGVGITAPGMYNLGTYQNAKEFYEYLVEQTKVWEKLRRCVEMHDRTTLLTLDDLITKAGDIKGVQSNTRKILLKKNSGAGSP